MAFGGGARLISDFTGPDEDPLSEGGNWAQLNSSSTTNLQRTGNAVGCVAAVNNVGSYWTPANFGPDLDAYVTITVTNTTTGIVFRVQQEGGAGTWDGYAVRANKGVNTASISTYTNGAAAATLLTVNVTWANGDKLGGSIQGTRIDLLRMPSGSGSWTLLGSVNDATYQSAGKIGLLFVLTSTARMDDFYAGPIALPSDDVPPHLLGGSGW